MSQDVIDDIGDRAGGVDADAADGEVFAGPMEPQHKRTLLGQVAEFSGAGVQTPMKCFAVDLTGTSKYAVAMYDVVTASFEFYRYGRPACSRGALDQVVSLPHISRR